MSIIDISKFGPMSISSQVSYNYGSTDVNYSSCQYISNAFAFSQVIPPSRGTNIPANTSGIHINNFSPNTTSNLSYPKAANTYKSSELFILPTVHKVGNSSVDIGTGQQINGVTGELIIKHTPITGTASVYLCFFLAHIASAITLTTVNDIDNIISFITTNTTNSGAISTTLQNCIPAQNKALQYTNSNGDNVFVFTNPIPINSASNTFITNLSQLTATSPPFLLPNPPVNGLKVSTDNILTTADDNIYMDCRPTGISESDIKTYSVPINSEYTTNAAKIDLMATVVQLSVVFALMVASYFLVPMLYKKVIVDNVNKFILKKADSDNNTTKTSQAWVAEKQKNPKVLLDKMSDGRTPVGIDTHIRLSTIDLLLSALLLSLFFINMTMGLSGGFNFANVMVAIYFMIFFVLSMSTIQLNKMSTSYLQSKVGTDTIGYRYSPADTSYFYFGDIFNFIGDALAFIKNDSSCALGIFFCTALVLGVGIPVYLLVSHNVKSLDGIQITDIDKGNITLIAIYGFIFSMITCGAIAMEVKAV